MSASEPRPLRHATLWLLGLGALFFSSYNAANWLASQRASVPSIVFAWESFIPYWSWSIVPYWSIDLFYCASLFICATRRELKTHACRLLAAQLISVAIFVAAPLRCTLVRPETSGLFGALLDALLLFDKPFNQAPALHISLLIILWVRYARHLGSTWRWLLHLWFVLIGVSVLTTYQHQFFDIPTGAWTGLFCIWLFPDKGTPPLTTLAYTADARRRQLARRYFAGSVIVAAAAIATGSWGLWFLWATGSLLLIAFIYLFLDATAFQKGADGRMSLASVALLAPYLAGAWCNSRWWTRHAPLPIAITPQVWLGRLPGHTGDLPDGVRAVVDLCAELPCPLQRVAYTHMPALDLVALTPQQLERAAWHITHAASTGPVLVCCALGYSRSAAAIAAWLITSRQADHAAAAEARLRTKRPQVVLSDLQRQWLDQFARSRG